MQHDDQPWSPFPVQDWSTLPPDPIGGAVVNPTWAPPKGRPLQPAGTRAWWLPLVAAAVVAILIAVAAAVATRPAGVVVSPFAPEDGAASYELLTSTRELSTTETPAVTESARLVGVTGLLGVDAAFGAKILPAVGDEQETVRLWRTVTTVLNDPTATAQTVRLYRVEGGISLLGESGPAEGHTYLPALVELPAGAAPGRQWEGAGSAGDALDYRTAFRAEDAGGGCLRVTGQLRFLSKQGQLGRTVNRERTWCPSAGLVAGDDSFADLRTTSARTAPPGGSVVTEDTDPAWTAPERWQVTPYGTTSANPSFGDAPMTGSPQSLAPVRTASGLVVRALSGSDDLVAFTPKTPTTWTSVWRSHPGGRILTLTAFGNVTVVTTSHREAVGYSDTGVRLWQLGLTELAPAAPVRLDATHAVLVDLAGDVRTIDLAGGAVGWQASVGADVRLPPVVGGGAVVLMDRAGTTTALDAGTGRPRWSVDLEGTGAAVAGDAVAVVQDQTVHTLDLATGSHRWVHPIQGTLRGVATVNGRLLVATPDETLLLDPDGVLRQRFPGSLQLTVAGEHAVAWGPTSAVVLGPDGREVTRWELPALTLVSEDRLAVALANGVMLTAQDWTFRVWDDQH